MRSQSRITVFGLSCLVSLAMTSSSWGQGGGDVNESASGTLSREWRYFVEEDIPRPPAPVDRRARTRFEAGGDDLRSLLTLPGAAVPNDIAPRPLPFARDFRVLSGDPPVLHLSFARTIKVRRPYLWASLGTILGGVANVQASGYKWSEFRLGFNSWESEKIALRQQGADMVQHFILGYGLTRYFLDNGRGILVSGVSAFTYEFFAGEVFESFPQAGGISVRDVFTDIMAVTVAMIDHSGESPLRYWAGSQTTVKPSAPNEFDPYRIGLGVAVGKVGGLDFVLAVENWKDVRPVHPDQDDPRESAQSYVLARGWK